jgi:DNA-binding protein YbaB
MSAHGFAEGDVKAIHDNILRLAADTDVPTVTGSAGGLVSVTMDTVLRVRTVAIHDDSLSKDQRLRLEQSIAEAVNSAVRQAATVATDRLKGLAERPKP